MNIVQVQKDCFIDLFEDRLNTRLYGKEYYLFVIQTEDYWVEISVPINSNPIMFWDRDFSEHGNIKIAGSYYYEIDSGGEMTRSEEIIKLIDKNANEVGEEFEWNHVTSMFDGSAVIVRSSNGKWYNIYENGEIVENDE